MLMGILSNIAAASTAIILQGRKCYRQRERGQQTEEVAESTVMRGQDERWDSLSYCASESGQRHPEATTLNTSSTLVACSIMADSLCQRCECVTWCFRITADLPNNTYTGWKCVTQSQIISLDIKPSFMLQMMPDTLGLTIRHARSQIWLWIRSTDGQSAQHHLAVFFYPRPCQEQAQTLLTSHIQWEKHIPLLMQSDRPIVELYISPTHRWSTGLDWNECPAVFLSFLFPWSFSNWVLRQTEQEGTFCLWNNLEKCLDRLTLLPRHSNSSDTV